MGKYTLPITENAEYVKYLGKVTKTIESSDNRHSEACLRLFNAFKKRWEGEFEDCKPSRLFFNDKKTWESDHEKFKGHCNDLEKKVASLFEYES